MGESVSTSLVDRVAVIEMRRGPNNFFDEAVLSELSNAVHSVDGSPEVRCIVLCSEGKNFCAGADLRYVTAEGIRAIYRSAFSLFTGRRPMIAAIQGAAIGGGLGLALAADFRVALMRSRFSANFAKLGFHHGFGLSVTLPAVVGHQRALELLYTGRSLVGAEAAQVGLCDRLVETDLRGAAIEFGREIADSAPLSLASIRATMRRSLVAAVYAAIDVEAEAQCALLKTADFQEGIRASVARRPPAFAGE